MGLVDWALSVALTKAGKRAIVAGIGSLTALVTRPEVLEKLASIGVTIDFTKWEAGLTAIGTTGLVFVGELIRNWMKHKKGMRIP